MSQRRPKIAPAPPRRRGVSVTAAFVTAALGLLIATAPGTALAQDLGALGGDHDSFRGPPDYLEVRTYASQDVHAPGSTAEIAIEMRIVSGVHVNAHVPTEDFLIGTDIAWADLPEGVELSEIEWPTAKMQAFEFTEGKIAVYDGRMRAYVTATIPADAEPGSRLVVEGTLTAQGCTHVTCYAPQKDDVRIKLRVAEEGEEPVPTNESKFERASAGIGHGNDHDEGAVAHGGSRGHDAEVPVGAPAGVAVASMDGETEPIPEECEAAVGDDVFRDKPLWLAAVFAYFFGLVLTLTPCVLPLVPVTVGFFSRQQDEGTNKLALASLYVLGLALIYSALGTVAALTGSLFGSLLQNPIVIVGIVGIFLLLALSMLGILPDIRLPSALSSKLGRGRSGPAGAFGMGAAMGIVAAPCVGPAVGSLLGYVAALGATLPTIGAAASGFTVFFLLALGLGTPFFLVAMGAASIQPGAWMVSVKKVLGFVILGVALWFARPLLPEIVVEGGLVLLLVAAGIFLLLHAGEADGARLRRGIQVVATLSLVAAVVVGVVYSGVLDEPETESVTLVEFEPFSDELLASARAAGRPVMIDFRADWCIACVELEERTFPDPAVQAAFAEQGYLLLKVDATHSSENVEAIQERFDANSLPSIVFLDRDGEEVEDLRLKGFETADKFVVRLGCADAFEVAALR